MKDKPPFGEKFKVVCTEDHAPYIPLLVKFQYGGTYQAAKHCGGSNCAFKVWHGPDEANDSVTFTEQDFQRWFEKCKSVNSIPV